MSSPTHPKNTHSEFALSDDQEAALQAMIDADWRWGALFLTGAAGTGKSTVLRACRL